VSGISISGPDAGNYSLSNVTATTTANITAVTLTASIIGNPSKPYDGNAAATLTSANFSLAGLVGTESFTVTKTTGTYDSKDVVTAATVTTSLASGDFSPVGAALASNYVLPTTASGAGQITAITLTASIGNDPMKIYDGNTNASLISSNFSLTPLVGSESFTVTKTTGSYNSKDVATATTVTASLASGDFTPTGGALASNYVLPTTASGVGQITPAHLTVNADNKSRIYGDANPLFTFTVSGFVNGETVSTSGVTGSAVCTTSATQASHVSAIHTALPARRARWQRATTISPRQIS